MIAIKTAATVLIMAGVLGLTYGQLSSTRGIHETKSDPLELSMEHQKIVNVPIWAGVGASVIGGLLVLVPIKRSPRGDEDE